MAGSQAAGTSCVQRHTCATEIVEPADPVRDHSRASPSCYVFEIDFWISGNNTIILSSKTSNVN